MVSSQQSNIMDKKLMYLLDIKDVSSEAGLASLPFAYNDATVGVENEFQTVVQGSKNNVDLPQTILASNYFKNLLRRAEAGDAPRSIVDELSEYLSSNQKEVWENSWVRFPRRFLTAYANDVFIGDLHSDREDPCSKSRADSQKFIVESDEDEMIRVPVSYLLKIALADVISIKPDTHVRLFERGSKMMNHFLNDNTSPETFSFYPVHLKQSEGHGKAIAAATAEQYLFIQLLLSYATKKFHLDESGQIPLVYCAPNPPMRQKYLNDKISDSFYRELFMSPCLSGWKRGEEKHTYMHLCHQVISRSQLNVLSKLREAGIITRNLVVLPNPSNVSLACNGVHVSLGSNKLKKLLEDPESSFTSDHEKYYGDLVIKVMEHFLPLFTGTYSAAPYRLDFSDFHPEKILGFLPHELDFTHLRMLWRRWKKKAKLKVFGQPVTPFGPLWLDRAMSRVFRLKGDLVADYRLIDYLVCLLSTDQSPALDGKRGNDIRLKSDLHDMGVFDSSMSLYLLYKLREHQTMGFSGFEGRYYSLFQSFTGDMSHAVNLQLLLTALAYQFIVQGKVSHDMIPDNPTIESERRQIFFGAALGIPTFYVWNKTQNLFLKKILDETERTRMSRRYPGYCRVYNHEYLKALLNLIKREGQGLIALLGLEETVYDLEMRTINYKENALFSRLIRDITKKAGVKNPLTLNARDFNLVSEDYYRTDIRISHTEEGFDVLLKRLDKIEWCSSCEKFNDYREIMHSVLRNESPKDLVHSFKRDYFSNSCSLDSIRKVILLMIFIIDQNFNTSTDGQKSCTYEKIITTSVC